VLHTVAHRQAPFHGPVSFTSAVTVRFDTDTLLNQQYVSLVVWLIFVSIHHVCTDMEPSALGEEDFQNLQREVLQQAKKTVNAEKEGLWNVILGFVHAVDWGERWIQCILLVHVVLILLVLVFRRNSNVQLVVFSIAVLLIAMAQPLNSLGAEHWDLFATQPYFDKHGAFISAVLSCPLVLIMCVILVNCAAIAISDAVRLKREQLKRQKLKPGDSQEVPGTKQTTCKND
jgi:transmembrane protein 18